MALIDIDMFCSEGIRRQKTLEITFSPSGIGYVLHLHRWLRTDLAAISVDNAYRYVCTVCGTIKEIPYE